MQSDRFFNALKGHGAPSRLVILPFESHGYAARESIMPSCGRLTGGYRNTAFQTLAVMRMQALVLVQMTRAKEL